ncbi:MAG: transglutaminase family protein [Proteobacteria bacterium]|nr:transglutaminase family protein [Pseudomonadota bacterium]MDA1301563.1 transglutaminase family protein [Pseudomonadota bacterium]
MAIHVALNHVTSYAYDRMVTLGPQIIRLRPAPHSRTHVLSYSLDIEPKEHFINWQQDPHGNYMARVVFPEKVRQFRVQVDVVADMAVYNPFDFFLEPEAETYPFVYDESSATDLEPYLVREKLTPLLKQWIAEVSLEEIRTVDFLVGLNRRLSEEIDYVIRMEPGVQTPEQTLEIGRGSCRDSAWLLCQILRRLGIASRFVSGYLIQLKADQEALDGPSGTEVDFTDLHAWTEAYLPGAGWVGVDPTSGLLAGEGHIPLAATPHPSSAAPISGEVEESGCEFGFDMSVQRVYESPRVTKPYDEPTWERIKEVGREIDLELKHNDVRLTVGGEPTFVAIDHTDAPEWNTEAIGPHKYNRAIELIKRIRERFAPGGALHYGQGKWYPGEQLPRWALGLYWLNDGQTIWRNPDLIEARDSGDYDEEDARSFATTLAARLELDSEAVMATFEDPWHFMGQERKLSENLTTAENELEDPFARERLARVFERGLSKPSGYVLPVQRWNARDGRRRWRTERWSTRSGKLLLIPGDSSVGWRLPLNSLPFLAPHAYPHMVPLDPFAPLPDLPNIEGLAQRYRQQGAPETGAEPPREPSDRIEASVRTAFSFEVRGNIMTVFMPPVEQLDDYLELLAAVEATAEEQGVHIHIEGYPPPFDPRLNVIKVTPDPGVIEVNIHPCHSWDQMLDVTETLYAEARKTRLDTQKFMLDGRHTGTGGGNHVVLGGPTPADSPFLRRPDMVRSLVAFWQQHPSMSYLFSGLFIGPTSQAPRIDEARQDSLHELELAFTQVPDDMRESAQPWLVDRIFRNLLVDVTGNTHRAEICIDKLYSPEGATGRLGLVEFRAFEMPPHSRMSLAQQLLLLSLVSWFWKHPNRRSLVRWGTRLHDRFMLPDFVWRDFAEVIADVNSAGYPLELDWFAPHFEFRFPRYGSVSYGDMELELRQALEPWHVLGEEGSAGGTVRYVDSSLERLQVKVSSFNAERYCIACNGQRVPLVHTEVEGEYVGGVRFRAWQPSSSLHPTITTDVPLTFDIYDCWNGRPVAGCTYHAAHPGGRNFEHYPVNSNEAESRRLARFQPFGHGARPYPEPRPASRDEFPHTLDLRWP